MKHKGPILTLAAGVAVAAILMTLNIAAKNERDAETAAGPAAAAVTATASQPAETTPPAKAEKPATYAGSTRGGAASIAIAVKDGTAIAYVCDGSRVEAWLQGSAANGELALTGPDGDSLTGTYGDGSAAGTVVAAGKSLAFSVKEVKRPSGLYRAAGVVRGAQVVGGWIVLAGGEQVGLTRVGDEVQAAPRLDPASPTVTINGTSLGVAAVDGSGQ